MVKINFNDWAEKVPDYTLEALRRYFEYGLPPGSFLNAVLTNDLFTAMSTADEYNKEALSDICQLVHWEFPTSTYGNKDIVINYMAQKLAEREKQFAEDNDNE